MARFNEILVGRVNRSLQKLFAMKGGPPAPQLASEITVNHQLQSAAENRYLEGWNRYAVAIGIAAGGVGNRAGVRIRNPVGSTIIAVIEKITVQLQLADSPQLNFGAATDLGGAITTNTGLDARGSPTPNLIVSGS